MHRRNPVIALMPLLLAGCVGIDLPLDGFPTSVKGSGIVVEEQRQVEPFEEIEITEAIEGIVRVGDEQSVVVSGDDNIVAIVETTVSGDRLTVGYPPNTSVNPTQRILVEVTVPALSAAYASGASTLSMEGLDAKNARIEVSGASRVTVSGAAVQLSVSASGASRVDAGGLSAQVASVAASGASNVEVDVADALTVSLSGASSVCYRGDPEVVSPETSGASTVAACQ